MSDASSKGEKKKESKGNPQKTLDDVKESQIGALEETILKKFAKSEETAGEPSDRSEEPLTGMESLEEEILERYAVINEELASETETALEADSISPEEETLQGYAPTEDEPITEPEGEEPETDATPLDEEAVEMPDLVEVAPPINDDTADPSGEEEVEDPQEEDVAGEDASEEDMPSDSEVMPPSEAQGAPTRVTPTSPEEVVRKLKTLREDVGQISELSSEEGSIVGAFSSSFLKLMESFAKTLPVDVSILPRRMGAIESANVIPEGELVVLFVDGRMESVDLTEPGNRDLLVDVLSDVMPKFNDLVTERRSKLERRITFLSDITKELQTIADSLAAAG
jgi:hypothetical protein